jgi:hypothetical protein
MTFFLAAWMSVEWIQRQFPHTCAGVNCAVCRYVRTKQ